MAAVPTRVAFFHSREQIWEYYRDALQLVEKEIQTVLESQGNLISRVGRYIFEGGGKRIRPLLVVITSKLADKVPPKQAVILLATAVELIHTASLLHDDVLDDADTRRGRDSPRLLWGNRASILIGDHLWAQGVQYAQQLQEHSINSVFNEACCLMTRGESLQLENKRNLELTEEEYLEVVRHKTAALISAACKMSGILSDLPKENQEGLAQFGLHLGLAYQIVDDALDYVADESLFGKSICKDLREGEVTLPLLHALSQCTDAEREVVRAAFKKNVLSEEELVQIVNLVNRYQSIQYSLDRAREAVETAKKCLYFYPDSPHRQALLMLADFVVSRNH
jgi:octaprenyl-diphosphate synthase